MKNVLLWIVSIFSMLLDAVKKQRRREVTVTVLSITKQFTESIIEMKGEQTLIIITSSIKDERAYKRVQQYADDHDMVVLGNYCEKGKRNFILKKRED